MATERVPDQAPRNLASWLLGAGSMIGGVGAAVVAGMTQSWETGIAVFWGWYALTPAVMFQLSRWTGTSHPRAYWVRLWIIHLLAGSVGAVSFFAEDLALRLLLLVAAFLISSAAVTKHSPMLGAKN